LIDLELILDAKVINFVDIAKQNREKYQNYISIYAFLALTVIIICEILHTFAHVIELKSRIMKEEKQKEMTSEFEPTRWIVPVLREPPTSMTLNPHISLEDNDLSCIGKLPEPKLFHVDEDEIEIV